MAKLSLTSLSNADIEFGEFSRNINECVFLREDGGSIRLMNLQEDEQLEPNTSKEVGGDGSDIISGINKYFDDILSFEAR